MKKIINIVLMVSIFLSSMMIVKANEFIINIGVIKEDGINVRSLPGTNSVIIDTVNTGDNLIILSEHPSGSGCISNWLNVKYRGSLPGYICGDFVINRKTVTVQPDNRFPSSYQQGLAEMKALHPNWIFEPFNSNIIFENIVYQQSSSFGRSLIQTSYDGWKHIDTYKLETNSFTNNYPGGGSSWFAASPEITSFYLDPRNFLNEIRIFQFEQLAYHPTYHTLEGVQAMLNGTFMAGKAWRTQTDVDNNQTYAQILMEAAATYGVNPYFLAARILQEVGNQGSEIVFGNYDKCATTKDILGEFYGDLRGYFNFYNINATGSSVSEIIICNGLRHAKNIIPNSSKNTVWNTEKAAILGGAKFLAGSYIAAGQDTLYLQKWDIVGTFYTNQYMQNIEAPYTESRRIFNNYRKNGLLDQNWIFKIPVYQNMPSSSPIPPTGSPINFINSLMVDGKSILGFNPSIYEYTVYVSKLKTELNISSTPLVNSATISGNGKIPFTGETYRHEVVVTAANGSVRKYYINFIRSTSDLVTLDDILLETKIPYDVTYIRNIPLNSGVEYLTNAIKKYESGVIVTVKDINGNLRTSNLGTGDTITITLGTETKNLINIRGGDLDGDGNITILDLLRTQRVILGTSNISDVFVKAGDVNQDGNVTIIDLLRIQKHILGMSLIE